MKNWIINLSIAKKLAAFAGILAVLALVIGNPVNKNAISVNAKELALSTVKDQDKVDVLTLADWIIKEKADFTLVDLRPEKEYSVYAIPTSINVKMEDLLNSEINRNQKILLYGNDDLTSAQAWFILKSSAYKGVYILNGGLNSWKNEILYPKWRGNMSVEDSIKFEIIKQISLHFGGTPQIQNSEATSDMIVNPVPVNVPKLPKVNQPTAVVKKKKEGC
jgi:rhodanese-related sulfurtransferase